MTKESDDSGSAEEKAATYDFIKSTENKEVMKKNFDFDLCDDLDGIELPAIYLGSQRSKRDLELAHDSKVTSKLHIKLTLAKRMHEFMSAVQNAILKRK